jgi:trk system potassium uptake protein TrkH
MVNFGVIFRVLGSLLVLEGIFMAFCIPVSYYYGGYDFIPLLVSSIFTLVLGFITQLFTYKVDRSLGKREGYIIVSLVWVVFSLFGALPFVVSGAIPSFTDAFFETMSGFTTTGASILNDIEAVPKGLLFWRSMTHWLGGMGIIVLSIAILPMLGIGGMQLFAAEVPGPTTDKLHPRIKETAKRLWIIYVIFTTAETVLLILGGMGLYDAVNHSFATMATGGFSTKQASLAYWDSSYIHYVVAIFMFIAGTNFTLSYFAMHFKFRKVWQNEEFRYYLGFTLGFSILIAVVLSVFSHHGFSIAFRDSLFQVVSIMTTTGFVTADYLSWLPFISIIIFMLMFFGGSAGSTGGGMKIVRVVMLLKNSVLELRRLVHPNAVIPVRLNKRAIPAPIVTNVLAFVVFYMLITISSTIVMSIMGYDLDTSIGAVAATLGNIGPGIGKVGPMDNFAHIPSFGKWFLSFLMLLGRLELFTVLVLFSPGFWRK